MSAPRIDGIWDFFLLLLFFVFLFITGGGGDGGGGDGRVGVGYIPRMLASFPAIAIPCNSGTWL